ncbi:hypothetical protein PENSPDRAFT_693425 [Peniophora sp. CONT]|nr:hypothetical protein PENSPDRAFT_693425 [Peniophora sp. CONT]
MATRTRRKAPAPAPAPAAHENDEAPPPPPPPVVNMSRLYAASRAAYQAQRAENRERDARRVAESQQPISILPPSQGKSLQLKRHAFPQAKYLSLAGVHIPGSSASPEQPISRAAGCPAMRAPPARHPAIPPSILAINLRPRAAPPRHQSRSSIPPSRPLPDHPSTDLHGFGPFLYQYDALFNANRTL